VNDVADSDILEIPDALWAELQKRLGEVGSP
jgi:hypothetical protein